MGRMAAQQRRCREGRDAKGGASQELPPRAAAVAAWRGGMVSGDEGGCFLGHDILLVRATR